MLEGFSGSMEQAHDAAPSSSPTLAGGVDPTAPPSPVSQTFNGPFRPRDNGVLQEHIPRV